MLRRRIRVSRALSQLLRHKPKPGRRGVYVDAHGYGRVHELALVARAPAPEVLGQGAESAPQEVGTHRTLTRRESRRCVNNGKPECFAVSPRCEA